MHDRSGRKETVSQMGCLWVGANVPSPLSSSASLSCTFTACKELGHIKHLSKNVMNS